MDSLSVIDELGQLINQTSFRYKQSTVTIYSMRETIWLGNKPVAQLLSVPYKKVWNRTWYYIMTDHLNTPRWVTDHNGVMLWRWESDAFGTTVPDEDVDGDGTDLEFNLRFPGQYYDQESGLHYNYFRDYEPGTGRYLESDPIGLEGGLNTYVYASSNSNKMIDLYGLSDNPFEESENPADYNPGPLCLFFGGCEPSPEKKEENARLRAVCDCVIKCGFKPDTDDLITMGLKKTAGVATTMAELLYCTEICHDEINNPESDYYFKHDE